MKKFVCSVCGYVYEGEAAPAECPVCHVGADKFIEQGEEKTWAAEHVVGVAKGVSEDIVAGKSCSQRRISGDRTVLGESSLRRS